MSHTPSAAIETSAWSIYQRLLRYLKPYLFWFGISVLGYILYALANVMYSKVMENLVTAIETSDSQASWQVPLQIILATLLRGLGMFIGGYFMAKVALSVVNDLRVQVFNHMTRLPISAIDARPSGHFLSLITYNINGVTVAATDALKKGIREGATVIALLINLLIEDWKLTLLFLSVAPIMGFIISKVAKRLRRLNSKVQDSVGDITQITSEMIGGHKVMRTFGGETYEQARFAKASHKNFLQNMKIIITTNANAPLMHLLIAFSMSLLIFAALHFMELDSTASFIGYITALGLIVNPIRQLGDVAPMILKGVAAADSVFTLLDEPSERETGNRQLHAVRGAVTFDQVCFRYPHQERWALDHLSLEVQPGEMVALVGKSGSGKTSLINLLTRFYDPQQGNICLDGTPIQALTLADLRSHIALVNQQVVLFEGSLADNISYGCRDRVSDADIANAAELAFVTEFAQNLPEGLDTLIGEGGARLSGGQRQRIAIARAILKNAPILILDEATSALDNESEHRIQAALDRVMQGRTTFVVAHRLSTVVRANRILVMDEGRIIEQGTHDSLLALNGHYTRLYSRAFSDEE